MAIGTDEAKKWKSKVTGYMKQISNAMKSIETECTESAKIVKSNSSKWHMRYTDLADLAKQTQAALKKADTSVNAKFSDYLKNLEDAEAKQKQKALLAIDQFKETAAAIKKITF